MPTTNAELAEGAPPSRQPGASALDGAARRLKQAVPLLLFGLRLWASVCLALYVAFWLQLDNPSWAGTSAAIMCQPSLGASLRKGWYRMIGTLIGATAIVVLTALFPQERAAFLGALALWGAACAFASTLLRNFAAYAAALAGFTVAIIASDQLGAVGGPSPTAFTLAVTRGSEICIGIVSAGIVLAGTDFGRARSRLAASFATLAADITVPFLNTLGRGGSDFAATQVMRRELLRRAIALDPAIDEAIGESSELRYHSPILQVAVDGLFAALAGWRSVAVRLMRLDAAKAVEEAGRVRDRIPAQIRSAPDDPEFWRGSPAALREACRVAARNLIGMRDCDPSLRLLAARTAEIFAGLARSLNGLALLTDDAVQPARRLKRLRVPDWLPSLVNGARALVTIAIVEIFWIVTAWPNGSAAITWAAVTVILFAPRADQAYSMAFSFTIGNCLAALLAAAILFGILPRIETFFALSLVLGLYLVPASALMAQDWHKSLFTAMTVNFVPLLAPANQMTYDVSQYANAALALVAGSAVGALAFRLMPPLSSAYRTRRLLMLTLRDVRRLAAARHPRQLQDWQGRIFGRLAAMPNEATPQQRAELLAATSVGNEIIRLRRVSGRLDRRLSAAFEPLRDAALAAFAQGYVRLAIERFAELDQALAAHADAGLPILRLRSLALAIKEALDQHAIYFGADGGA
jgi:uncharacterized membrane protein YccC